MSLQANGMATGLYWLDQARARHAREADAHVLFAHIGPVEHATVQRLVELAERSAVLGHDPVATRKRLINVLVEGLENLGHHAHPTARDTSMALLVADPQAYHIALGNALPYATAALLTHRMGLLNEMSEEDLKGTYMRLLGNEARSAHGGAGLGLLTIARKCRRPILAHTTPLDDQLAYMRQEIVVPRLGVPPAQGVSPRHGALDRSATPA